VGSAEIFEVIKGSIAYKHGFKAGDKIVSINGRPMRDILDYEMGTVDEKIAIELLRDGKSETITVENDSFGNLGIKFSTSLFDGIKTCANKCVFCFIDQLPEKMRREVYVKDDDYRLSFIYGNFVTLTNVREEDIQRVIDDRISPLYVSVHTTDPGLRALMLGRKRADRSLEYMKRLTEAGIEIHVQIVACPGLNDGDALEKTIEDLAGEYDSVSSVGIVPVGLTGHRDGLYALRSFEKQEIIYLIEQAKRWQSKYKEEKGSTWVYIADEFYIAAGLELPPVEHYEEFPQIENGIGLSSLFIDEVKENAGKLKTASGSKKLAVVTGSLFSSIMSGIVREINNNFGLEIDVIEVSNLYFGGKVNVTGLITGFDIAGSVGKWLRDNEKPDKLLVPDVILNGDGLMLDDYSPAALADNIGIAIEVARSSGSGFIDGIEKALRS